MVKAVEPQCCHSAINPLTHWDEHTKTDSKIMYTTGICGLESLPSCERQLHCLCFSIKTGHSFEEDRRLIEKFRGSKLLTVCGKCVTKPSVPQRADINMAMLEAKEARSKSDHVEMVPCQEIPHWSRQWLNLLMAFSLLGSFAYFVSFLCFYFHGLEIQLQETGQPHLTRGHASCPAASSFAERQHGRTTRQAHSWPPLGPAKPC